MGAQKKSGGPKQNFPALCAGNKPPTFNLLPTPLQNDLFIDSGLYLTGGSGEFDPTQEVADPQKVLQNLFGGSILTS